MYQILMLLALLCLELGCKQIETPRPEPSRSLPQHQAAVQSQRPVKVALTSPTSVTLSWNRNVEMDVTGYRVHYGTVSHTYTLTQDAGNVLTTTVANLTTGTLYYFAVTAYNALGVESNYSNEVSYRPTAPTPSPTPSPTATPTSTPTASPSPSPSPSATPTPSASPTATASPSPTPPWTVIVGWVTDCAKGMPVPGVTISWTGDTSGQTVTDTNGYYSLAVPAGSQFTVIPSKAAVPPGSHQISTIDVLAVASHFLGMSTLPCPPAGDVNGDGDIDTTDEIGIQRFILIIPSGTGFTGQYRFAKIQDSYNFTAALIGDVR